MSKAPIASGRGLEQASSRPSTAPHVRISSAPTAFLSPEAQGTWGPNSNAPLFQSQPAARPHKETPNGPQAMLTAAHEAPAPYTYDTPFPAHGHHTAPLPTVTMDLQRSSESSGVFSRSLSTEGPLMLQGLNPNTMCPPGEEHTVALLHSLMSGPVRPPARQAPRVYPGQIASKSVLASSAPNTATIPRALAMAAPDPALLPNQMFSASSGRGTGAGSAALSFSNGTGGVPSRSSGAGFHRSLSPMYNAALTATTSLPPNFMYGAVAPNKPLYQIGSLLPPLTVQPLDVELPSSVQPLMASLPLSLHQGPEPLLAPIGPQQLQDRWQQLLLRESQVEGIKYGTAANQGAIRGSNRAVMNAAAMMQPSTGGHSEGAIPELSIQARRQGVQVEPLVAASGGMSGGWPEGAESTRVGVESVGAEGAAAKASCTQSILSQGTAHTRSGSSGDADTGQGGDGQDPSSMCRDGGREARHGDFDDADEEDASSEEDYMQHPRARKRRAPPRHQNGNKKKDLCRERNRTAQRRFRERQKDLIRSLQETVQRQVDLIRDLKRRLAAYEDNAGKPAEQ